MKTLTAQDLGQAEGSHGLLSPSRPFLAVVSVWSPPTPSASYLHPHKVPTTLTSQTPVLSSLKQKEFLMTWSKSFCLDPTHFPLVYHSPHMVRPISLHASLGLCLNDAAPSQLHNLAFYVFWPEASLYTSWTPLWDR